MIMCHVVLVYVNIIVNRYTIDDDDYTTEPVLVSDIDNDGELIIPMETSPPSVGQQYKQYLQ